MHLSSILTTTALLFAGTFPVAIPEAAAKNFAYADCYVDTNEVRLLVGDYYVGDDANSIESCAQYCGRFKYFGTEFATDCYCGNKFNLEPIESGFCNTSCTGNAAEICGGTHAISVFKISDSH